MMYKLTGFLDVIFLLFLVMASLRRHFLSHGFQRCIFWGTYQRPAKFSMLWIVYVKFYRGMTKKLDENPILFTGLISFNAPYM